MPPGSWIHRLPARYRDPLPNDPPSTNDPPTSSSTVRRVILHVFDPFRTQFNLFGIARDYQDRPTHDPDSFVSPGDLSTTHPPSQFPTESPAENHAPPWPWSNMTTWRLMTWALASGHQKSAREVTRLVRDVIQAPNFDPEELAGFNAQTATTHLDAAQKSLPPDDPFSRDQWKHTGVDILIPTKEKN